MDQHTSLNQITFYSCLCIPSFALGPDLRIKLSNLNQISIRASFMLGVVIPFAAKIPDMCIYFLIVET